MKDIKTIEGWAVFRVLPASHFFIFLKTAVKNEKVRVIKEENIVIINIERETSEINIELATKVVDVEMLEKELKELKVNYNKIIIENRELRKRLDYLENEMKGVKKALNPEFNINRIKLGNKSVIMKENEFI